MANSEPVKVAVEIIDKFSEELSELEARLEKIDGKRLNVELEIDGSDIEEIKARLESLEQDLNANLDIDVNAAEAWAEREALEKDLNATLYVDPEKRGIGGLDFSDLWTDGGPAIGPPRVEVPDEVLENVMAAEGGFRPDGSRYDGVPEIGDLSRGHLGEDSLAVEAVNEIINQNVADAHNSIPKDKRDGWVGPSNWAFGLGEQWGPSNRVTKRDKAADEFMRRVARGVNVAVSGDAVFNDAKFGDDFFKARNFNPDLFFPERGSGEYPWSFRQRPRQRIAGLASPLAAPVMGAAAGIFGGVPELMGNFNPDEATGLFGRIGTALVKYRPTVMMWMNLVALLIPMMIALAGAALGAAAAIGSLAVAGGAVVGLGLLGYGENLAESMELAKRRIQEVKSELFDALQPVMRAFQPLTDELLGNLPNLARELVQPLMGLAVFEGFFKDAMGGATTWLKMLIQEIVRLSPQIVAIGDVVGRIFGSLLLNLLSWSVKELHENMGAFINLGRILGSIIVILYNLSKAVSFALAPFAPLFKILEVVSGYLANPWVSAVLSAVTAVLLLYGALAGLNFLLGKLTVTAAISAALALGRVAASIIVLSYSAAKTAVAGLSVLIKGLYGVVQAAYAARGAVGALLAMTGIGAVLAIGGFLAGEAVSHYSRTTNPSASDLTGGGYGGGYGGARPAGATINIYGDVGNSEYQKLKDNFGTLYTEQGEIEENTEK